MKKVVLMIGVLSSIMACQDNTYLSKSDLTGKELVYTLEAGSVYNISGVVSFKEKKDGSTLVSILLNGTENGGLHPVHLHIGNIATPDAAIAAILNPVSGSSGKSETHLTNLADESTITFNDLKTWNACIKVHLSEAGPNSNIILSGGNIGQAANASQAGRLNMAVCKSE
jgi:hypothetical protein